MLYSTLFLPLLEVIQHALEFSSFAEIVSNVSELKRFSEFIDSDLVFTFSIAELSF